MISRLEAGGIRDKTLSQGLASEQDIAKMIEAWKQWKEDETATFGLMNGEILIFK